MRVQFLHGIITVTLGYTGKCIDYWIRTKNWIWCRTCEGWEGSDEYEKFTVPHQPNCDIKIEISKLGIFSQKPAKKFECIGHIKKRLAIKLTKLKSTKKGPLFDSKTLRGEGRLTDKMINKVQSYFGMAIRQSTGKTVFEMKKAIGAVVSLLSSIEFRSKTSNASTTNL